jgi:hypothetical protein
VTGRSGSRWVRERERRESETCGGVVVGSMWKLSSHAALLFAVVRGTLRLSVIAVFFGQMRSIQTRVLRYTVTPSEGETPPTELHYMPNRCHTLSSHSYIISLFGTVFQ